MPSVNYNDVFDNMSQEEKDHMLEEVVERAKKDMEEFLAEHSPPGWRKQRKFVKMTIVPDDYWRGWIFGKLFAWRS